MRSAVFVSLLAAVVPAALAQSVSSSQYWHEKYHGVLSMAAYGDYDTLCPTFFTQAALLQSFPSSTAAPWTVIERWGPTASGLEGFSAVIPEMDKVVMVFKGIYGWENFNHTSVSINAPLNLACPECKGHQGALTSYLEAKQATNDWALMKQYVNSTGAQWSITGHAFGGMVAQMASLDLGWRGLSHWTHNHGSPRVFNTAAASLYNSLYGGEAGQRTVANNDPVPTVIPESDDYTFTLQGFHIYGTNTTYGMNYDICGDSATDPNCLGTVNGNITDHYYYYTPVGHCGERYLQYNASEQNAFYSSVSSSFAAVSTISGNPSTLAPMSTTAAPEPTSTVTESVTSAPATGTTAGAAAGASATGAAGRNAVSAAAGLVAVAVGMAVLA